MSAVTAPARTGDELYLDRLQGISYRPVFIIGPHRSGTTILYRVLGQTGCFNLTTAYHIVYRDRLLELRFTGREQATREEMTRLFTEKGLLGGEHNSAPITPDIPEEYCFALEHQGRRILVDTANLESFDLFCKKLQVLQDPARPLLLKNPYDTLNFPYLHQTLPKARFVFIYRHPVDVVNSQMTLLRRIFEKKSEYHALIFDRYRRLTESPARMAAVRFFYSERFPFMVRQVSHYVSRNFDYMMEHVGELGDAALGVTYPELCSQPAQTVRHILDFLGLQEPQEQDYSRLIRSRDPAILPDVEKHRAWIEKRNEAYLRRFGF
jgi:Sulfotransferase family